jgi:hypothetical protein
MGAKPRLVASGYSRTPLPKKLGIRDGDEVAIIGASEMFRDGLAELAPAAPFVDRQGAGTALVLWFVDDAAALRSGVAARARAMPSGGLWICWRKKTANPDGDVGEADVRSAALPHGIVDYKVCAIDATWSGLKFAVRRAP